MNYTCYTNLDSRYLRGYQQGDRLVRGWSGDIGKYNRLDPGSDVPFIAEKIFRIHNMDDRPDGQTCPSMSIGDVIVIGDPEVYGSVVTVEAVGFMQVQLDPADLITDRSWLEIRKAERADAE